MVRLYTITEGISKSLQALIRSYGEPLYEWVDDPATADFFVFPTNYEVGHELTEHYLHYFKGTPEDRKRTLQYESRISALASQYKRKIIIFFYSDLSDPIPIDHSIIFRTSLLKSRSRRDEYAMPAFKHDLSNAYEGFPEFLPWAPVPTIGFRGQSAPLHLKSKYQFYNTFNLTMNRIGLDSLFALKYNRGYLQRRNAMEQLSRNKNIQSDFTITLEKDIENPDSRKLFLQNMFSNMYTLCVSGFGNYSFRLYETLSAGRIPVFINTDCKLPFEDLIPWKEIMVWIEEKEIPIIDKKLLAFHATMKGENMAKHQKKLKMLWKQYLSPEGFFDHIPVYLK